VHVNRAVVALLTPDRDAATHRGNVVAYATCRPRADFLAQLVATSARLPQTRVLRRAAPEHAVTAYSAIDHRPAGTGLMLSRSL